VGVRRFGVEVRQRDVAADAASPKGRYAAGRVGPIRALVHHARLDHAARVEQGLTRVHVVAVGVHAAARIAGHTDQRVQLIIERRQLQRDAVLLRRQARWNLCARGLVLPGERIEAAGEVAHRRGGARGVRVHATCKARECDSERVVLVGAGAEVERLVQLRACTQRLIRVHQQLASLSYVLCCVLGHRVVRRIGRAEHQLRLAIAVDVPGERAATCVDAALVAVDARKCVAAAELPGHRWRRGGCSFSREIEDQGAARVAAALHASAHAQVRRVDLISGEQDACVICREQAPGSLAPVGEVRGQDVQVGRVCQGGRRRPAEVHGDCDLRLGRGRAAEQRVVDLPERGEIGAPIAVEVRDREAATKAQAAARLERAVRGEITAAEPTHAEIGDALARV
jgi:hypothetical protein